MNTAGYSEIHYNDRHRLGAGKTIRQLYHLLMEGCHFTYNRSFIKQTGVHVDGRITILIQSNIDMDDSNKYTVALKHWS